jgi:hypothetical protein
VNRSVAYAVARPSTSVDKYLNYFFASRVGLTPSPTCQTWARWFPQGDAATSATNQVARDCQPSSENRWRVFYVKTQIGWPCRRRHLLHRIRFVSSRSTPSLTNLRLRSVANEPMESIEFFRPQWDGSVPKTKRRHTSLFCRDALVRYYREMPYVMSASRWTPAPDCSAKDTCGR